MDIHDYINRIRVKTARRRKRLEKENRDRKLIRLHKEFIAIRKEMENVGWEALKPPVQRGYIRFFVLRKDVRRSKQAMFFQRILDKINTCQRSSRKDFKVKRRRAGRKVYVDKEQYLRDVEAPEFFSKKFTDLERLQFQEVMIHPAWSRRPVRVFRYNEPWRFVLRVQPDMITRVRIKDLDLEGKLMEITQYLHFGERRYRLAKLLYGKNLWSLGSAAKPPPGNPLKNRSLPDILSEYWPQTELKVQKRSSTHGDLFFYFIAQTSDKSVQFVHISLINLILKNFTKHSYKCYKQAGFIHKSQFSLFLGLSLKTMNIPDGLKYTKDHEWVKIEGDTAIIGITDFAQSELGDIVFVDISTVGQDLAAHDIFGTVEAVKTVSDLYIPVSGKVLEVNPLLESNPEKVNEDPYGDGWMIKVAVSNSGDGLLTAAQYKELIGK